MEFTANPAIGGNGGDWGSILNQILNELKSAANTLESNKANSVHPHTNLATSQALSSAISSLEELIENHGHTDLASLEALTELAARVSTLEDLTRFLTPDLSGITCELSLDNTSGGIRVVFNTNPVTPAIYYSVNIFKDGEVVSSVGSGNSTLVIPPEFFFAPVAEDDLLSIIGTIRVGQSTKTTPTYSFTYHEIASAVMQRITALENMDMGAVLLTNPSARAELAKDVAKVSSLRSEVAQEVYILENPGA